MKKLVVPLLAAAAFAAYHFGFIQIPEVKLPEIKVPEISLPVQTGTNEEQFLETAVPFVGAEEGKRNHAYLDTIANPPIWTVCYGETKGVKEGDYHTDAECDEMLRVELLDYRERLHAYFTPETVSNRLTVKRDVAFTSLAYNIGVSAAGKSTAARRLNDGDIVGSCEALTWFRKAGGRVVRGLVNRRAREQGLCLDGLE